MRKIYAILPLACALTFTTCDDYDDTALWEAVNGLEERIAALEQWQDETNNNIAALQKLLTTNDMITSVTPVMMGDETVGYTISFLHSDPITIYHGKKGDKGEDGVDGSTPQIGLTQQTDGNWYWTLNGELMTDSKGNPIRANGEDGKDGQDGEDGQDGRPGSTGPQGKPGADGEDGENAPAPQIMLGNSLADDDKIMPEGSTKDPNAWYLSVDNGATWYRVSGKDGSTGADGDSFFTQEPDVDYDKGTVTFYINGSSFEVPLHIDYIIEDDGTYSVYSEDGLKAVADIANNGNRDINITLDKDIDLTGTTWTPIGTTYNNSYTGTFDGGGKTITGLTVTGSNEFAGLFGYIGSGGTVKNVVLKDVQIASDYQYGYIGGVAGISDGNIENCSVSGSVSGRNTAGGVVGQQFGGSITMCGSSATVKGTAEVGGVAGKTDNSATLTACYATRNVTFERASTINTSAGGVVGLNGTGSILTACYAMGNVTGTGTGTGSCYVGGITGDNSSGTLTACYHATGTVSGPDGATGGVTGRNFTSLGAPVITACYWQNDQAQGIGYNQAGTGDTKKVSGDWTDAMNAMNAALNGKGWKYVTDDGDTPLVIKATN